MWFHLMKDILRTGYTKHCKPLSREIVASTSFLKCQCQPHTGVHFDRLINRCDRFLLFCLRMASILIYLGCHLPTCRPNATAVFPTISRCAHDCAPCRLWHRAIYQFFRDGGLAGWSGIRCSLHYPVGGYSTHFSLHKFSTLRKGFCNLWARPLVLR